MKAGQSVSYPQLERAVSDVRGELSRLGIFEDTRLEEVEVLWCALPQLISPLAHGFYISESSPLRRSLGYLPGNIYIPRWVIAEGFKQRRGSLRDVLRHEYGHALAYGYPKLIQRSVRFREFFGVGHDQEEDLDAWEEQPDSAFVSNYARSNPGEDFAETFMVYLRRQGPCPKEYTNRQLRKKWRFVAQAVQGIRDGFVAW